MCMLTQYFMHITNTQENGKVYFESYVFSHDGRLSPAGCDETSEAMFMHGTGTCPVERQNRSGKRASLLSLRLYRHHGTWFLWPISSRNWLIYWRPPRFVLATSKSWILFFRIFSPRCRRRPFKKCRRVNSIVAHLLAKSGGFARRLCLLLASWHAETSVMENTRYGTF